MNREKLLQAFPGAVLAWVLSVGALGSMVTALDLNPLHPLGLALFLALSACLGTVLGCMPRGVWPVSGLMAVSAVWLWWYGPARSQTMDLLHQISVFYHGAYGWAVVDSPYRGVGPMDLPLAVLGLWIAGYGGWNLARGFGGGAVFLAALPMAACVVVTDTVPAAGFLFLWLLALTLVLLSKPARRQDLRQGNRMVLLFALPVLLALGLLFRAVPREGYDRHPDALQQEVIRLVQELPELAEEVSDRVVSQVDGAAEPDTIRLDTLGPSADRRYPVMEVTAPITGVLYLRGTHYDTYTGTGWTVTGTAQESFPLEMVTRQMGPLTIRTSRVRELMYLPYYPRLQMTLTRGRVENDRNLREYSVTMQALPTHWKDMVMSQAAQGGQWEIPAELKNFLALPEQTRSWAQSLPAVGQLMDPAMTATDKADAIAAYVSGLAAYDRDTPRMDGSYTDFARWFVEQGQTGYCVHYATTAVVLLRAAGIPARYVEGYMTTVRADQTTAVAAGDAHAWAEYYEPLLGLWVRLEATPGDPEDTGESQQSSTTAPAATDPIRQEPGFPTDPPAAGQTAPGTETPKAPQQSGDSRKGVLWLMVLPAALGVLELQRLLRRSLMTLGRKHRGSRSRALDRWRQLERLHRLLGTEPPEEARFLAEKAGYSRCGITPEELRCLEENLREAGEQLGQCPLWRRILGRYIFLV